MEKPPYSEWYEQHRAEMIARIRRQLQKKESVTMSEDRTNHVKELTEEAVGELSVDQKKAIALEAKTRGIEAVAQEHHLPVKTVRAYVGVYTRNAPPSSSTEKSSSTPVSLVFIEFTLPQCTTCERNLDPTTGMLYLETAAGRFWFCRKCASGIQKLTAAVEIPCQIQNSGGPQDGQ